MRKQKLKRGDKVEVVYRTLGGKPAFKSTGMFIKVVRGLAYVLTLGLIATVPKDDVKHIDE